MNSPGKIRIKTSYVCPPIPCLGADWEAIDDATYDMDEPVGRGATEIEAVQDLLEQLEAREP